MRRKAALVVLAILIGSCGFQTDQFLGGGDAAVETLTVGFAQPTSLQDEASGTVQVIVRLSRPSTEPITVDFAITGGNAEIGLDYTADANGRLSFPANITEAAIPITIAIDAIDDELDETIELTLSTPSVGAELGTVHHTVTINHVLLPRVNFTLEASDGDEANNLTLELTLDTPPLDESTASSVTIAYKNTSTAALTFDWTMPTTTTVTFPVNTTSQSITIPIINDMVDEDDEHVIVEIATTTNIVIGTKKEHDHTIKDNDNAPTVSITTASTSANEGNTGTNTTVNITVSLLTPSGKMVTVPVTFGGGTATEGSDYSYVSKADLVFVPNQNPLLSDVSKTVSFTVNGDVTDEDNQTVITSLTTAPMNATLAATNLSHTYTITDDDMAPTIAFMTANQTVVEGDSGTTTTTYVLELSAASEKAISCRVALTGNATIPMDYTTSPTAASSAVTISIAAGMTTANLDLIVVGDTTAEGSDETITMTIGTPLSNVRAGAMVDQARTHTIDDSDP